MSRVRAQGWRRLAVFSGWLALGVAAARAVAPNLASVVPAGGQRGTEVAVTLKGDRLADAQDVLFYSPGITVEKLVSATTAEAKTVFKIAPDCRLGEHAFRLRTTSGLSALRIFFVGPFPSVDEREPNNTPAKAQAVALNSTVQGTNGNEDVDCFVVEARQGQRLVVEVEGARLGRTMFDPIIMVAGADGRELARSDDSPLLGHDGFVSLLAPADGRYFIQLRDVAYAGNGHFYRLHVSDHPRPALALPLGGKAGETVEARFVGDPAGEWKESITFPAEKAEKSPVVTLRDGGGVSPNWVRVTDLPDAGAIEAGTTPANAPVLNLPAPLAFDGVLANRGMTAFFRFKAKKDQNLNIEVFARRLGSPLDPVLTVLGSKGAVLGNNDDAAGHPDSALRVRIPEDGDYTVKVADQLGRGGPLFAYRVEISPVGPALTLSIPDTARYDNETRKSLAVPRGNRFAILLNANRDAFSGDFRVEFDGLPAGITMHADAVPGSLSAGPVVFEADATAPIAGRLLRPSAKAVDAAKAAGLATRFRHKVEWVRIQNDTVYVQSEVDQIAAAVVEEVPFTVRIVEPKVPLVQGGEMALKIVAEKKEGFDEAITLKMLWNPPGVSAQPDVTLPKGASEMVYKLNAGPKAETRAWKIAVVAGATVKGGTAYVSTQLAPLEIAAPYLLGKIALTKVERGKTAKLTCVLEQKRAFEGTAIARLVGLPDGVTAREIAITKDSNEAVFEVVTTDRSPTGNFKNVSCNVVVTETGEPVSHTLAPGSVLRIDAPKTKAVAAAGAAAPTSPATAVAKSND
ncbi:MAG: PPC domain-containing protein [Verrucomicrobia bacterium]|nr:PPC domain-containing protein [Verrucomicrobiota bacterium]